MSKTKTLLCLLVLVSLGAAGCHTAEGFGKDMEAGGRKIKEKAQEHE